MMNHVTFSREDHARVQDEALDLLLGAVEPADRDSFDEHIASCEQCREFLDETRAVIGLVGAAGDVQQPPPELRAAILAEAAGTSRAEAAGASRAEARGTSRADTAGTPFRAPSASGRRRRREGAAPGSSASSLVSRLMAVAAVIALIAAVGWGASMRSQRDSARQDASHLAQVVDEVSKPGQLAVAEIDATQEGRSARLATAFVRDSAAMVVADGLGANDSSSTIYVLWSMTSLTDSTPVAIGSFDITGDAPMTRVSATGQAPSGSWFAISLEEGRRVPPAPTMVLGAGRAG